MNESNSQENEEIYKIMFKEISKNNKIERNQIKNKLNKDNDPILFAYSSNNENINNNNKNEFNFSRNHHSKIYEEYLIRNSQRKERPHLNTQNKKQDTLKLTDEVDKKELIHNDKRFNLRLQHEEKAHQIKNHSKKILNPNLSNNINKIFNNNNIKNNNNNNNKFQSKRIFNHNNTSFDTLFSGKLKICNKKHFIDRNKDSVANEMIYQ